MRITGLATGLDVDEIVKSTMKPYRIKIDKMGQKKDVLEIKQKLYRDIMSDASKFFDKYLDIAKSDSLLRSSNYKTTTFKTSDESILTVKGGSGAQAGNYRVKGEIATASRIITKSDVFGDDIEKDGVMYKEITIEAKKFVIKSDSEKNMAKELNAKLKDEGINVSVEYSEFAGNSTTENNSGFIFQSTILGSNSSFTISSKKDSIIEEKVGKDGDITITNIKTGGVFKSDGKSNTIKADDITFIFNGPLEGKEITVTGNSDVSEIKDKLVNFIKDYNTLIEKINSLTMTKHVNGYDPLTSDQKSEMSESEIKLWNEKVESGQLYRDANLTRISNAMKTTMRSVMEGSGLSLERIGITPVKNYSGTVNGTFSIDEDKLEQALKDDIDGVMNLFIANPEDTTTSNNTSKVGILYQLKNTIDKEFKSSTSALAKKAGIIGTASFNNNEITKSITDYENKMKDMESTFTKRQQALYSKYATLETMMNKLNAQQANLSSQLGLS